MNNIEQLTVQIISAYPDALILLDRPNRHPDGFWHLDVTRNGKDVAIQWSADHGFDITRIKAGEASGPDEHVDSLDAAFCRLDELLSAVDENEASLREKLKEAQAEIGRLHTIIRVNALRWVPNISHAEIDAILAGETIEKPEA